MKNLLLAAGAVCVLALFSTTAEAAHGSRGFGCSRGGGYYPPPAVGYYGYGYGVRAHPFIGRRTFYGPPVRGFGHRHDRFRNDGGVFFRGPRVGFGLRF